MFGKFCCGNGNFCIFVKMFYNLNLSKYMNIKSLQRGGGAAVRRSNLGRVRDASSKSIDLFLGNKESAEEYDLCKKTANIIDDWVEDGKQGVTYKEVVDYLTTEGFVHYKDASPKREYWTTKNRLTTAGLMIMHTNNGNGELENEIVYICDFVSNIPALPKAMMGDSARRRVKDSQDEDDEFFAEYGVFEGANLLEEFDDEDDAIEFAKEYDSQYTGDKHIEVINLYPDGSLGDLVWSTVFDYKYYDD